MPKPPGMKAGSPDEFQTDPRAIGYILPYLKKEWKIWECAMGKGNLFDALTKEDFHVEGTDILTGFDFLSSSLPSFDCIVTNPPFSLKEEFLGRCYMLGKPFALLMPITTFDSEGRRKLMAAKGIEVILPTKRIHFETPNSEENKKNGKKEGGAWFYSAWFTWGLNIGRQLVFCDDPTMPGI